MPSQNPQRASKRTLSKIEQAMLDHYLALNDDGEFENPPSNDDELHEFIELAYGFTIPRKIVVKGHASPFSFIADMFFERTKNALAFANRNGGKTLAVAVLNHLDMLFKPGCEVASAGAVRSQAKKCYAYFQSFMDLPWFKKFEKRYRELTGRSFVTKRIQEETTFDTRSEQQIITATEKGLRSPHPHKARVDEIDEIPWSILQTGLSMARTAGGIKGQNCFTSTRQFEHGSMQRLLDESEAKGIKVYEWNCVLPETWMFTGRGLKMARDVRVGDTVLSEDGAFHRVVKAWSSESNKNAVRIYPWGWTEGIGVTEDHRMLIRRDGENKWVEAGALVAGDVLFFPKLKGSREPVETPVGLMSVAFAKFLGFFLGDGCLDRGDKYVRMSLADGRDTEEFAALVEGLFDRNLTVDGQLSNLRGRFGHKELARWLAEHFYTGTNSGKPGKGGRKKVCPSWVVDGMSDEMLRAFVVGLMKTDGCFSFRSGKKRPDASFKQTSNSITQAFFLACVRLGLHPSLDFSEQKTRMIEGRRVNGAPFWKVRFAGLGVDRLAEWCGVEIPGLTRFIPPRFFEGDTWFGTPIRKIETDDHAGPVFDFAVEDVHSFSMPWAVAHNCWEVVERCTRRCFDDPEHGTCPIYAFCKGKAHSCDGFFDIEDFIDKVRLIDREKFETEWLNAKPSRGKLIYHEFDTTRHVMTPQRLSDMTGVTAPSAYWPRISGIDFGSSPGHPFVYLKLCRLPNNAWLLFYEYAAEQKLMEDHARAIKASPWYVRTEPSYADTRGLQERMELKKLGVRTKPADKAVLMGIDYVGSLLRGFLPKEEPMLYIWHECKFTLKQFGMYRWPVKADGTPDRTGLPLKRDDDAMDALRYALYSDRNKPGRRYRSRKVAGI